MGSSRNSRAGSVTSSTPTESRRRSPPLTPRANSLPTRVPRHFCRPCARRGERGGEARRSRRGRERSRARSQRKVRRCCAAVCDDGARLKHETGGGLSLAGGLFICRALPLLLASAPAIGQRPPRGAPCPPLSTKWGSAGQPQTGASPALLRGEENERRADLIGGRDPGGLWKLVSAVDSVLLTRQVLVATCRRSSLRRQACPPVPPSFNNLLLSLLCLFSPVRSPKRASSCIT